MNKELKRTLSVADTMDFLDWCLWTLCCIFLVLNLLGGADERGDSLFIVLCICGGLIRIRLLVRAIRVDALKRAAMDSTPKP